MRNPDVTKWKIAVLGAGTMGQCIAQLFAMNGHKVNLLKLPTPKQGFAP